MSRIIEKDPPAKALIFGIRAIGYSFSTAVADIIDNSISADAKRIDIISDPLEESTYFEFLDNGCGMDQLELENAMLLGSDRMGKPDSDIELGRYGLGLKSASLSQCREFIVASKKDGQVNAISFDLDLIEKDNKWYLKILDGEEIEDLPNIEGLLQYETGTLVIWKKFDKLESLAKNFEDSFRSSVANSKKHVEFVFHRFYNSVDIYFNYKRIEARDPFLRASVGRQQTGYTEKLNIDGCTIAITPYALPFWNTLTNEEKELLGNPKSIYDDQGFYLYRNKRLILWGSWLRMGVKSELNKLARVQVDIPSALDSVWMLDVKKSSAKIPDKIKDELRASINDSELRSKKTVKFPGIKEQIAINKIWERRINTHDNTVRYEINRNNPVITALYEAIGDNETMLLEALLSQLECYIPKFSIQNDIADSIKILNSGDDVEEDRLINELINVISMISPEEKEKKLKMLLSIEAYQKLAGKREEVIKEVLGC